MQLLAQMGGPPPGTTDSPGCCGVCLWPVVFVLAVLSARRHAAWPAVWALALVGVSFVLLWSEVGHDRAADGWTEADVQRARGQVAVAVGGPLVAAGLSLGWAVGVRLRRARRGAAPASLGAPPGPGWCRRRAGWLIVLAVALAVVAALSG